MASLEPYSLSQLKEGYLTKLERSKEFGQRKNTHLKF